MTKNQTLRYVTDEYLQSVVINCFDDIDKIEEELLAKVHEAFDEHNIVCDKDKKWKAPDSLNFSQIAKVINAVFNVRLIDCGKNNSLASDCLLGIYIDDFVAQIIKDDSKKGTYVTDDVVIEKVAAYFNDSLRKCEFYEISAHLMRNVRKVKRCEEKDLVAVNNGIFNYATKELHEFDPEKVFLTKPRIDYNPNATNVVIHNSDDGTDWDVESWMASLSDDPEIVNLLWEIPSALLRPNVRWDKSAWLESTSGNNGKGTLCEMYRELLGDGAWTSIPIADFNKEFMLEPLTRATAVIVDENDVGTYIDKAGNLKSVITNDVVQINRKFKTPIPYQFHGFMVQCLNEPPRIKDKTDSFYRRQLYIPMTKCFTGMERKYIKNDYLHRKEVLEYVMKKALESDFYKLSEPASCMTALTELKEFNDPVRQFWSELRDEFVWNLLPFQFLHDLYKNWYKKNVNSNVDNVLGKQGFITEIIRIVSDDDKWFCSGREHDIRVTKSNMNGPEPLIARYQVTDWMAPNYKGSDINKISMPALNTKYRGIQRVTSSVTEEDEEQ